MTWGLTAGKHNGDFVASSCTSVEDADHDGGLLQRIVYPTIPFYVASTTPSRKIHVRCYATDFVVAM